MKILVNGVHLNFEISGKDDAPTVVLSHSLGCSLKMWDLQVKSLESEYRVLRFDTRGHGLSDAPNDRYSLDLLREDALALVDALNLEKFHWVGISMGGMIGQYLALHSPKRLMSLVLSDTGPFMPPESQPVWQERIDQARDEGMQARVKTTLADWFTADFIRKNPPVLHEIKKQLLSTSVDGYEGCIWAIRGLNCIDRLKDIKTPTLIMVGKEDSGTPVEVSQLMHERIPHSNMIVIPDASHLSSVEQPDIFNRSLLDFLRHK